MEQAASQGVGFGLDTATAPWELPREDCVFVKFILELGCPRPVCTKGLLPSQVVLC